MFNARIRFENFGGRRSEKGSTTEKATGKRANARAFKKLTEAAEKLGRLEFVYRVHGKSAEIRLPVILWRATKQDLIVFMKAYKWYGDEPYFKRETEFLESDGDRDPEIDSVLVIVPQRKGAHSSVWRCGGEELSVWGRSRIGGRRFGAISGSAEREIGDYLARVSSKVEYASEETASLKSDRMAVMLVYPLLPRNDPLFEKSQIGDNEVSIGLGVRFPHNKIPAPIVFGVKDHSRAEDIVVDDIAS